MREMGFPKLQFIAVHTFRSFPDNIYVFISPVRQHIHNILSIYGNDKKVKVKIKKRNNKNAKISVIYAY